MEAIASLVASLCAMTSSLALARRRRSGPSVGGVLVGVVALAILLNSLVSSDVGAALLVLAILVGVAWVVYRLVRWARPSTPKARELYALLGSVSAMSGGQFEVFMAQVFRAMGYRATVLGGSGDQGVDIIVQGTDGRIAVQCKNYKRAVGNKPVQEVYPGAKHHRCEQAWVVAPAGYTKGARELARSVGVRLFDADSIRQWIQQVDDREHERQRQAENKSRTEQPERKPVGKRVPHPDDPPEG